MKVYLAAPFDKRQQMELYAYLLELPGHTVTSRWIRGGHDTEGMDERVALIDWEDVRSSDCLIAFTEPVGTSRNRGGRHVEFGAAVAWGKRVIVVGPRENVFYSLPDVRHYEDWDACYADAWENWA